MTVRRLRGPALLDAAVNIYLYKKSMVMSIGNLRETENLREERKFDHCIDFGNPHINAKTVVFTDLYVIPKLRVLDLQTDYPCARDKGIIARFGNVALDNN